jgi:hypothetical protein
VRRVDHRAVIADLVLVKRDTQTHETPLNL